MSDLETVRRSLLSCLRESLPTNTPEGNPTVLHPGAGKIWMEATLPYNLRLADVVGPLALVYRMDPSQANHREPS
jgi:hypothetical protein